MDTFHLQIVTPDGLMLDGQAEKIIVRTTEGDVGILSGHADYAAPVDTGVMSVVLSGGETRTAACSGGLLSVKNGTARIVADTFEWAENIDVERARRAKEKSEQRLKENSDYGEKMAEIKLKRALARIRAGEEVK